MVHCEPFHLNHDLFISDLDGALGSIHVDKRYETHDIAAVVSRTDAPDALLRIKSEPL